MEDFYGGFYSANISDPKDLSLEYSNRSNVSYQKQEPTDAAQNITLGSSITDVNSLLISFYVPVFLLSVTANILVIVVVVKYHYMRNVTNLFLVNLSVADLLVTLLCMPVQVSKAITIVWYYGEVLCKTVHFMQGVAVAASVFTITAMAVDRYLAINQSVRISKLPNRKAALVVIILLWLVAMVIFSPLLWVATVEKEIFSLKNNMNKTLSFCFDNWRATSVKREIFGAVNFILVYLVPGFIMTAAYSLMGRRLCSVKPPFDHQEGSVSAQQGTRLVRERRRVARILLLLAVLFAACWLPYNTLLLLLDTGYVDTTTVSFIYPYTLLLGHANSAINPIVYCFMARTFRRSVRLLVLGTPEDLTGRLHQRCKQQVASKQAVRDRTSSSAYYSYHSPHLKCYLQMHNLKGSAGAAASRPAGSGTSACRLQRAAYARGGFCPAAPAGPPEHPGT